MILTFLCAYPGMHINTAISMINLFIIFIAHSFDYRHCNWKYYSNSVYPTFYPKDICMDETFFYLPSDDRKIGKKGNE